MNTALKSGSKHFALQPLAEGIYAAIAEDGGAAICNAGMIDLGGQLLVFDSFLTPQAAADLRQFAIDIYGRTPQIVINSHYHNDHIWGNQVFAKDSRILSSAHTRELISTAGKEEYQWYASNAAQRLETIQAQFRSITDEEQRTQLSLWRGYYEGLVEAWPHLKVTLPDITYDTNLKLYGEKHTAQLITFRDAHTGSDTVLHLPQAGIVFMSDLLFVNCHPYLADGDPLNLLNVLKEISQLEASVYVPGHGPVGTIQDVEILMAYIEQCFETAQRLVETGNVSEDKVNTLKIPGLYQQWQQPQFYRTNIRFLSDRLSSAKSEKQTL